MVIIDKWKGVMMSITRFSILLPVDSIRANSEDESALLLLLWHALLLTSLAHADN
jgi:hypothetical protein